MSQDAPRRVSLAAARAARTGRPEVAAAYEQARLRFELAEAVRARREELGWSQRQLAERAGIDSARRRAVRGRGTTPTLPLLERLAARSVSPWPSALSPPGSGPRDTGKPQTPEPTPHMRLVRISHQLPGFGTKRPTDPACE